MKTVSIYYIERRVPIGKPQEDFTESSINAKKNVELKTASNHVFGELITAAKIAVRLEGHRDVAKTHGIISDHPEKVNLFKVE